VVVVLVVAWEENGVNGLHSFILDPSFLGRGAPE